MHRRLKWFLVAGVILIPLFLIFFVWPPPPPDPTVFLDPKSANYPQAVLSLRGISDLLVTVAMAVLGASGLLIARVGKAGPAVIALAGLCFIAALMSIFFASRVGFAAAFTLAASKGDVTTLLNLLNNQALATLLAGLSLAAIAVLEGFEVKK